MTEIKVNSDLLKCENHYFTEESKTKSLLITKSAKKGAIIDQSSKTPIKTEKISSSVLNRAKQFLDLTKTDDNIAEKCDLVDENSGENEDQKYDKQMIEMNLMVFQNKKHSNDESSDEESESQSTDSDSEDTSDSESEHDHSDDNTNCLNKDK